MEMTLSIIQVVVAIILILLVLSQESPKGASGALTGSADLDSHFDKIKGRTSGAILKKLTGALGAVLIITTLAINIV